MDNEFKEKVNALREKINAGENYNALSKELRTLRKRAKALCFEYNQTHPDQKGKKQQTLSKLLAKSPKATIESNFHCDYGDNISLGANFYANHDCTLLDAAKITIGDNVMLGPKVTIATSGHPLDAALRIQGYEHAAAIELKDNVWVGANCCILGGVTIGENAVIAAGAVVTSDIPNNTLAAGIPAKVIKVIDQENHSGSPL